MKYRCVCEHEKYFKKMDNAVLTLKTLFGIFTTYNKYTTEFSDSANALNELEKWRKEITIIVYIVNKFIIAHETNAQAHAYHHRCKYGHE